MRRLLAIYPVVSWSRGLGQEPIHLYNEIARNLANGRSAQVAEELLLTIVYQCRQAVVRIQIGELMGMD